MQNASAFNPELAGFSALIWRFRNCGGLPGGGSSQLRTSLSEWVSLVSGKITGKFQDSTPCNQLRREDRRMNWAHLIEIPTKHNRVFFKPDQGTKNQDQ